MRPSPPWSRSPQDAKETPKPVYARQQQDARSGMGNSPLQVETTPGQRNEVASPSQKTPNEPNDSHSMTSQPPQSSYRTAATEQSSERAPGENSALPLLSIQVAPLQLPSRSPGELPTTTLQSPEDPALPPPSWIQDRRSSQTPLSGESSPLLSLVRNLSSEPITGQQLPRVLMLTHEPLARHTANQKTAPEAAIPSLMLLTTPELSKVTSYGPQAVDVKVARSTSPVRLERHEQADMIVPSSPELMTDHSRTQLTNQTQEVSSELRRVETSGVSIADAIGGGMSETVQQGTSTQCLSELKRRVSLSIYTTSPIGAGLDATATQVVCTGPLHTGVHLKWVRETKARGALFIVLHCLAQALTNILFKKVVDIPKTKIAYYVAFGHMLGNMPQAFSLSAPFGPRHVQVDVGLRGMASLMSLMLKAEALRYIVVSDLAVANTLVPVCVMVLSWYFLEEGIGLAMWTSVSLCLCGVVIVMRPTLFFEEWDTETTQTRLTGFTYAFGSALSQVLTIVLLRLTRNNTNRFLGFNSDVTRTVLALTMSMVTGEFDQLLDGRFLPTLVIMSKLSFCSAYFLNKALQSESGAFVTTTKFSGDVIFAVILQMAFLDLYPDVWTLGGVKLVVLSFGITACENVIVPSSWQRRRRRQPPGIQPQSVKDVGDKAAASATVASPSSALSLATPRSIATESASASRD